jgi:hypothetical protein
MAASESRREEGQRASYRSSFRRAKASQPIQKYAIHPSRDTNPRDNLPRCCPWRVSVGEGEAFVASAVILNFAL